MRIAFQVSVLVLAATVLGLGANFMRAKPLPLTPAGIERAAYIDLESCNETVPAQGTQ